MSSEIPTVFVSQYAAKCFLDTEEVTNTLQLVAELVRRFELPSATGCSSLCKASRQCGDVRCGAKRGAAR